MYPVEIMVVETLQSQSDTTALEVDAFFLHSDCVDGQRARACARSTYSLYTPYILPRYGPWLKPRALRCLFLPGCVFCTTSEYVTIAQWPTRTNAHDVVKKTLDSIQGRTSMGRKILWYTRGSESCFAELCFAGPVRNITFPLGGGSGLVRLSTFKVSSWYLANYVIQSFSPEREKG